MRSLVLAVCCTVLVLSASGPERLKSAETHHLAGTVVDENGQPVADAHIDHIDDRMNRGATDASGRFSVEIHSPAIVIRKAGYKSTWLRAQDGGGIKIQMESLGKSGESFPVCAGIPLPNGQKGLPSFRLPKSKQLSMSQGSDVDYAEQIFRLKGVRGKNYLVHGSGPTWSFGIPLEHDVWDSVTYEERVFSMDRIPVLDARGTFSNGKQWRILAMVGETVGYDDASEKAAVVFDAILDQTCFER